MADVLSGLSEEMAGLVAGADSYVVRVDGRRRVSASGILWAEDLVVTAHHILEVDETVDVVDSQGGRVQAEIVGRDPSTDLAVLRAPGSLGKAPTWVDPEGVRVGHMVLAIGRPRSSVQATLGIVSALGGAWRTPMGGQVDHYLQTDVVMYPGFSGGPLVDAAGGVIGLNTSALLRGVSVSLPKPTVKRIAEALLEHGRIQRGFLGVSAQPVRLPAGQAEQAGQETGLLLASTEPDGPAEAGGLLLGDVLVGMNGNPLRSLDDLLAGLGDQAGKPAVFRLLRGGEIKEQSVTLGERP